MKGDVSALFSLCHEYDGCFYNQPHAVVIITDTVIIVRTGSHQRWCMVWHLLFIFSRMTRFGADGALKKKALCASDPERLINQPKLSL